MNPQIRSLVSEVRLDPKDFIYPLFIRSGEGIKKEVESMPDVYRMSIDTALKACEELQNLGISHIILFGIPDVKDSIGSEALDDQGIIARAVRAIKEACPYMSVSVDVCFCEYTDHGHCGILDLENGSVNNDLTLEILGKQAVVLAKAGADMIAPSGMMDGMVCAIRHALDGNGFVNLPIMSYSTKFASAWYGPFRDAAESAPGFGDRRTYQMNPANRNEALLESLNDEEEGADILMVKPALAYLDVIRDIKENSLLPVAAYNVSGEYSVLKMAGRSGLLDYEKVLLETMISFRRAGADILISYHAKEVAKLLA